MKEQQSILQKMYQKMVVRGDGDVHYFLQKHPWSPVKTQLDNDAATDESSHSSSSFASPTSSCTACDEVSSLLEPPSSDIADAFHGPEIVVVGPSSKAHLDELIERAQQLLQREQAPEYKVGNYFHRTNSSVDPMCRYMMMEWSFRMVEFFFPPPPPSPDELDSTVTKTTLRRKRKRSIEALQLIYTAFSYIDRISTSNDPDRSEFRLLSIVCLHLAAKTSGLFSNSGHEASWSTRKQFDEKKVEQQLYFNPCQSKDSPLSSSPPTPCFTACVSDDSDVDASRTPSDASDECREEVSGQTIFSTPGSSSSRLSSSCFKSEEALNCKPRPSMELLSLSTLSSLYGGDVYLEEMKDVEWTVLQHGLQWKLGVSIFEWLDVFLDLAKLRLPRAWTNFFVDWDCIQERAWVQLESAIEHHCFMTFFPSLVSLAAFMNAIEEYNEEVIPGMLLFDRKLFEDVLGFSLERDVLREIRLALSE